MKTCKRCGKQITGDNKLYCSLECKNVRVKYNCIMCGKECETVPSNTDAKYCSVKCRNNGMKKPVKCVCIICGKKYTVFERYNNGNGSKFCSQKCKSSQKISKTCPQCGKIFLVKPSQSSLIHCSRVCQVKSSEKKCIRICKLCGKEFKVRYPSYEVQFCSVECFSKDRSKEGIHLTSTCATCGKQMKYTIHHMRTYCSKKCYLNNNGVSMVELMLKDSLAAIGFEPQLKYDLGHMDYGHVCKKIAVFVDGKFWHGRSDIKWEHTPMAPSIKRAIVRDKEQNKYLNDNGWIVLRFWDDYVQKHTDECVSEITKMVNNR